MEQRTEAQAGKGEAASRVIDMDLVKQIGESLLKKEETLAVAESVTSGFIQLALSQAPKAMSFYHGGITAYNLGQKFRHLHIDPIHAESYNCVSDRIACEMAQQVCQEFSSDWGMAITGFAAPVPESHDELYAWAAIVRRNEVCWHKKLMAPRKDSFEVQQWYTNQLLEALAGLLNDSH